MTDTDVLIVGAGPTGLVLALWLTRLGVQVRIVDKTAEPGTTSRALVVQARTLEFYRQLGLADEVVRRRAPVARRQSVGEGRDRGARCVRQRRRGSDALPVPAHLSAGRARAAADRAARASASRSSADRTDRLHGTRVIASSPGCAGPTAGSSTVPRPTSPAATAPARSCARASAPGFPGGTYRQLFYVADVDATGPAVNGELHIALDEADFLGVFPLAGTGKARLIGTVRDERADDAGTTDVWRRQRPGDQPPQVDVEEASTGSRPITCTTGCTDAFPQRARLPARRRRAHPQPRRRPGHEHRHRRRHQSGLEAGRRGGRPRAGDNLLDTYEAERIGFARRLVATTDRVFSFATAEGRIADILRTRIAPLLIPRVAAFGAVREYLFRTVSQVMLNYRGGPLSRGAAGHVQGGDRLPWVRIDGADNFASLASMDWQVHVYGAASAELIGMVQGSPHPAAPCSAGDPNMRRPGSRAMRSICCGPTAMWRWPTAPARRMPSPATSMISASGLRRARQARPD